METWATHAECVGEKKIPMRDYEQGRQSTAQTCDCASFNRNKNMQNNPIKH